MKIGVVGAGFVGATAAYALVMRGIGRQVVLVDRNEARAKAEADDLLHAVPFAHPLDVVARSYRTLLGRRVGVDAAHVHAYVVGEHGDSEVLTWSMATVGGIPLAEVAERHGTPFTEEVRAGIDAGVRGAAYAIIAGKGATYYGVGSALACIAGAVLGDRRSVLTVCTPEGDVAGVRDVTASLPRIVGGAGVLETLPLRLPVEEERALAQSAGVVRAAIDGLDASG